MVGEAARHQGAALAPTARALAIGWGVRPCGWPHAHGSCKTVYQTHARAIWIAGAQEARRGSRWGLMRAAGGGNGSKAWWPVKLALVLVPAHLLCYHPGTQAWPAWTVPWPGSRHGLFAGGPCPVQWAPRSRTRLAPCAVALPAVPAAWTYGLPCKGRLAALSLPVLCCPHCLAPLRSCVWEHPSRQPQEGSPPASQAALLAP